MKEYGTFGVECLHFILPDCGLDISIIFDTSLQKDGNFRDAIQPWWKPDTVRGCVQSLVFANVGEPHTMIIGGVQGPTEKCAIPKSRLLEVWSNSDDHDTGTDRIYDMAG